MLVRCSKPAWQGSCSETYIQLDLSILFCYKRHVVQAQEQLFCARRILGNSYVAAYYFYGNDMFADEISPEQNELNQNLFEDQQQQLEMEVTFYQLDAAVQM